MKRSEKARKESRLGKLILRYSDIPDGEQDKIIKLIDMEVGERVWFYKEGYTMFYGYCPLFQKRDMSDCVPTYEAKIEYQEGCKEPLIEVFITA
jgi:hypothetical protein